MASQPRGHARAWLPNALTVSRVVLTALAYVVVLAPLEPRRPLFAALVLLAVATDVADGPLARRLGTESPLGRSLDTVADTVFYGSLIVWLYLWNPDLSLFGRFLPLVYAMAVLILGTLVVARIRGGSLGFHSPFTRASCTAGVVGTLWTILFGYAEWLVYAVLLVLLADLAHRFGTALLGPPKGPSPERDRG